MRYDSTARRALRARRIMRIVVVMGLKVKIYGYQERRGYGVHDRERERYENHDRGGYCEESFHGARIGIRAR